MGFGEFRQQLFSPPTGNGLFRGRGRAGGAAGENDADRTREVQGPAIAVRLRPLSAARNLWANVAASATAKLGTDAPAAHTSSSEAFVTEPKTGLQLPGEARCLPHVSYRLLIYRMDPIVFFVR